MTTNDHIAAIKEHLKAIEAEKQTKPKRYIVMPTEAESTEEFAKLLMGETCRYYNRFNVNFVDAYSIATESYINQGKIITVNEE